MDEEGEQVRGLGRPGGQEREFGIEELNSDLPPGQLGGWVEIFTEETVISDLGLNLPSDIFVYRTIYPTF